MKKTWVKKSFVAVLSLCLVVCCAILCVHISNENKLDEIQQDALDTLTEGLGTYDEKTIVLNNTSHSTAESLANKLGAKLRITGDGRYATLTLAGGMTVQDVYRDKSNRELLKNFSLDYYSKTSETEEISEETVRQTTAPKYSVSDSLYSYQSYLDYLHIENTWENYKGSGITVAVIDTGIDTDHPEFNGKISEYSYNATDDKIVKDYMLENGSYDWSLIEDEQGHGTSVAGVIAASMDGNGIVGIAPDVTLLVIKAECDDEGNFLRTSDLVFGLYYAIERDADVVNMSFGSAINVYAAPARLANDSDVALIAAAGNDSSSVLTYPAADENVIGVGALEDGGWSLAAYSNFGDNTDIVAPGTVYTTAVGGGYRTISGTSFASPVTAAAVALLKSQNKYIENDTVTELLYASSYDLGGLGGDYYYGYGALDISALVLEERGTVTFDMLTDELDDVKQVFIRNHTLQNIPEPDRNYAVFDGWYYDIHCTEELNLYSDVWTSDITLYAKWANEDDSVPYTYVILDDGTVEIRSYTGHRKYITIPEKIEGRTVSSIGDFAFSGQTRLREVNLPRGLKKIGLNAFADCSNLFSMSIPDGVEEIGSNTFVNDARLNAVIFGQNSKLKSVGNFAFRNCELFNFELPVGLESINGSAFAGCTRLTNFSVRKGNKSFTVKDGVLYSMTKNTLVAFPAGKNVSEYILPDETLTVGKYAFAFAKAKNVDMKNTRTIEEYAFSHSSLTSLTIPAGVNSLGVSAFEYNFNLKSVILGQGITTIPSGAFYMNIELVGITLPKNIQYIMGGLFGAFEKCVSLTSVTFEENSNLAYIGKKAFSWANIDKIIIPKNVVTIDSSAFECNFNLFDITFEAGSVLRMIGKEAFANTYSLINIALSENLVSIGDFAFIDSGLTGVTIPKSVTELGVGAFASCHSLENIFIESGNENYVDVDGVVYSGDNTVLVEYPAGKAATEYSLLSGTKEVGNSAFYGAWNLKTVSLPQGVETVGEYAFYDCKNVTSYSLSETLTSIERYAFAKNSSLGYISVPDNVVQISNYAFAYDHNLNTIYFSETSKLPRISYAAFAYTGIYSMRIPANVSTVAQNAFTGCDNLNYVSFAANSKLDIVPAYMFSGANNINGISFESGSSLTNIASHGFEGMRRLTSIDFGDAKLKNIDNYAFRYCENLQTVNIPEGVTNIGRFAFYGCKNLTRLDLPETIEHIGRFAFYFAENLNIYFKADTLPANLQENWDYGIAGYYVGVTDVLENGDWKYAALSDGGISIIKYTGSETALDLTALDFGGEIKQIGGYAFAYSKITSIILPETLENIQRYAFAYSKLESVTIPSGVSFIGQYAFFNAPVKTVTFGENSSLYKIEQYAFAYTSELNEIIIPNSVEEIQSYAFYHSGIEKVTFEHGTKLNKIAAHAFASSGLISVVIPDSVNYIDDNAFRDCLSLQTVTFGSAENLQVHANAFYNTAISSLYIPANLEYVGEYAFVGLENLESYAVAEENPHYTAINGVLYEKDGRKLIAFPAGKIGSFEVPNTVETIGFGAFENTKIESISFADGINLLTLGYRAFYNAENLKSVSIPASVVSIDYYAFAECRNLETVTFAKDNLLTGIYDGAFLNCISLKNITIPDSIVEISDYAFYGCSSLTRLPFGTTATVKGIYDYAFAYTGIRELIIPETVTEIGAYAFRGSRVKTVVIPDTQRDKLVIGIGALQDCDELEDITLPFIGESFGSDNYWFGFVFGAGMSNANYAYIPKHIKKLKVVHATGDGRKDCDIFMGNLYELEEVYLPDGLPAITYQAFAERKELSVIRIPESVKTIGNLAFSYCEKLTQLTIPGEIEYLGYRAFNSCKSLTEIEINGNFTSIGDSTFTYCEKIKKIVLPDTVTEIGEYSFGNCFSLEYISEFPGLISIGRSAFYNCKKLQNFVFSNGIQSIGENAFWNCAKLTQVELSKNLKQIGNSAFSSCSNIRKVKIGNATANFGDYIFAFCRELTDVTLPSGLKKIPKSIFCGCSKLENILIPDSVTEIGESAFGACIRLSNLSIPDGVTIIGNDAFYNCNSLIDVVLPSQLTNLGEGAFRMSLNLGKVVVQSNDCEYGEDVFGGCNKLVCVESKCDVEFEFGSTNYGSIALFAKVLIDKNGTTRYLDETGKYEFVETVDKFRFIKEDEIYKLIAYFGDETTVTLPETINGNAYKLSYVQGVENVVFPASIEEVSEQAFTGNEKLKSVVLGRGVKKIGEIAFADCVNLQSVTMGENILEICYAAFV